MSGRSWAVAGVVLGVGAGGFVDGIIGHQLLEWHHMLSGWYPPAEGDNMRANMLGDGFFHLFSLVVVLVGIGLLAAARPAAPPARGRRLVGWMIAGWGGFNLVEGLVDHQILGVHHVRQGPDQLVYDLVFLALGAILVAAGAWVARPPSDPAPAGPRGPVRGRDLRRLLDSDLPDPVLVLREGRAEVVPAAERERAGLEVVSREAFLRQAATTTFTDAELDRRATNLSSTVNRLGG